MIKVQRALSVPTVTCTSLYQISTILNLQIRLRAIFQIQTVCAFSIFVKKIIIIINNDNK